MATTLFLDIDGVLNPHRRKHDYQIDQDLNKKLADQYADPAFLNLNIYYTNLICNAFDTAACERIKQLVSEFHCKVVLTSSWRISYTYKELTYLFKILGIGSNFVGCTPMTSPRFLTIQNYIEQHKIKNYLVIDDFDMTRHFPTRCICTHNVFSKEDYENARKILKTQTKI